MTRTLIRLSSFLAGVSLLSGLAVGCGSSGQLEAAGSDTVETRPNTRVSVPFRVVDDAGSPMEGITVSFSLDPAGAGGARLESEQQTTDAEGGATAVLVTGDVAELALVAVAPGVTALRIDVQVVPPEYAFCTGAPDCTATGQSCLEVRTSQSMGAFCTVECTAPTDCAIRGGFTGTCMNVDGLGGTCFQECNVDADCLGSSVCLEFTDADELVNTVCLPNRL